MRRLLWLLLASCTTAEPTKIARLFADPLTQSAVFAASTEGRVFMCGDYLDGIVSTTCSEIPQLHGATSISRSRVWFAPFEQCASLANGSVSCQTCNDGLPSCGSWNPRPNTSGVVEVNRGCAVLADGSTACWGDLALGTFPLPVSHLVAAFALLSDGSLFTRHGLRIDGIDHVTDASQSSQGLKMPSACAVTSDTSLYCWGSNDFGQLGDGTTQERTAPTLVGNGFLQVVQTPDNTNDAAACALTTVGSLVCWGQTVGALTPVALGVTSVQQLVVQPSASPAVTDILGQFYALTVDGTIIELSLTGGKPLTIQ